MKYLRLNQVLEDIAVAETINFNRFKFNGGEQHIKLLSPVGGCDVVIEAQLKDSDSVMELLIATDALRRADAGDIILLAPYIPYSRQDRVMASGESLSIRVMCDLINLQGYKAVYTLNNHSEVTTALLSNCFEINEKRLLQRVLHHKRGSVLISPDAGAAKKVDEIGRAFEMDVVHATKERDAKNGDISNSHIDGRSICGKDCVIIDDICDGGRTFIELTKVMIPMGCDKISLYVSHGIFSKGVDFLKSRIDKVYVTNCFLPEGQKRVGLDVIKLRKEDLE